MNQPPLLRTIAFVLAWFCVVAIGIKQAVAQQTDRDKILNSADWKQTMQDLDQWASVQQIYDKTHIAKLRQQLEKQTKELPVGELLDYLKQIQQKLKILQSQEARDARKWLDETFAVAAPAYAEKIRSELPDIATLTPAQLQLQLDQYMDRIAKRREQSQEFAKERKDTAKRIHEKNVRDQQAMLRAKLSEDAAPRSNYNFSTPNRIRTYRPAYYPRLWGGYRW